jgi:hypothetical protein
MNEHPDHDGTTVPNNVVQLGPKRAGEVAGHPLPWYVDPPHDFVKTHPADCSEVLKHHAQHTVCDAFDEVVCECNGEDEGHAEAVAICMAVNRAGPQVCECGKRATCFGSYESDLRPAYACDDCCGHGNEDGHCEPVPA